MYRWFYDIYRCNMCNYSNMKGRKREQKYTGITFLYLTRLVNILKPINVINQSMQYIILRD